MVRRYFLDTEFIEYPGHIELISIGIVGEFGDKLYCVNRDADLSKASEWVIKNVLEKMPEYNKETHTLSNQTVYLNPIYLIKEQILGFTYQTSETILNECEFWGYFCDYDWVVFCWVFGTMMDLPKGFPMYCLDLKQFMHVLNLSKEWKQLNCPDPVGEHNALVDAEWNKKFYNKLQEYCDKN